MRRAKLYLSGTLFGIIFITLAYMLFLLIPYSILFFLLPIDKASLQVFGVVIFCIVFGVASFRFFGYSFLEICRFLLKRKLGLIRSSGLSNKDLDWEFYGIATGLAIVLLIIHFLFKSGVIK